MVDSATLPSKETLQKLYQQEEVARREAELRADELDKMVGRLCNSMEKMADGFEKMGQQQRSSTKLVNDGIIEICKTLRERMDYQNLALARQRRHAELWRWCTGAALALAFLFWNMVP